MFSSPAIEQLISLVLGEQPEITYVAPPQFVEDDEGKPLGLTSSPPLSLTVTSVSSITLTAEAWEAIARHLIAQRREWVSA